MTRATAPRVLITGVGAVTPLGQGATLSFERWVAGDDANEDGRFRFAAFDPSAFMTPVDVRRSDRFTQLAVAAADEAVAQAGWDRRLPAPVDRIGCVVATSIGGLYAQQRELETFATRGPRRVSPLGIPRLIPNAAAATLSIRYGLRGESFGLTAACASGAQSIGAALRMLDAGEVDAMLVGGTDTYGTDVMRAMLKIMGATSRSGVLRPFDRRRDGFIPGEGAAILVLEREDVALGRGADVLGELLGYGASNDAHSLTAPRPDGSGVVQAMRTALRRGGIAVEDVDYINPHGTSTRLNDRIETEAIREVFGVHARQVPVSSVKASIGHLGGAAGSVEAVLTLLALRAGTAPPTVGLEEPDDGLDLDYVPGAARPLARAATHERLIGLSNSFGFGGHNATVALAAPPAPRARP